MKLRRSNFSLHTYPLEVTLPLPAFKGILREEEKVLILIHLSIAGREEDLCRKTRLHRPRGPISKYISLLLAMYKCTNVQM